MGELAFRLSHGAQECTLEVGAGCEACSRGASGPAAGGGSGAPVAAQSGGGVLQEGGEQGSDM